MEEYDATNGGNISSTLGRAADPQQLPDPQDHGTHVAGIAGAVADNEDGIAGVGWLPQGPRVRIMPVTVLDDAGEGTISDIVDGLMYAAGMIEDEQPEDPADVINLSLGGGGSAQLEAVLEDIRDAGITVVAAAGNFGCGTQVLFPAAYPSTIAVGSANPPEDNRATYSNCGDTLDIVAPGGAGENGDFAEVKSLDRNDDYTNMAGTSMAAPHVSGVAALLYAVTNDMTPSAVRQILTETASPVTHAGSLPNEEYGWGLLNAERAVRRALMKPYGPYRNDGSATVHESWPFSPQGNIDIDTPDSTEPPPEGTYATDRAALVLEDEWYSSTSGTQRQARLDEIAQEHGLASIADRGHRYPSARLRDGDEISTDLLEALGDEPEIRTAEYSVFFYRQ